ASSEFVSGADAQSAALGFPDVARIFVEHPIQDRTDDEMRAIAAGVIDSVISEIIS
ncbi:MAG: UGSC family (seleno)protein, partial [Actinomycetota bacterium]|nr:UGSC family (seleno)protein [Actinomycetota bacterium]